jgi:hypothetical protein
VVFVYRIRGAKPDAIGVLALVSHDVDTEERGLRKGKSRKINDRKISV